MTTQNAQIMARHVQKGYYILNYTISASCYRVMAVYYTVRLVAWYLEHPFQGVQRVFCTWECPFTVMLGYSPCTVLRSVCSVLLFLRLVQCMYIRQERWVTVTKFTRTEPYYTEYSETVEVYSQHKTMTLMVDRSSLCKRFRL